MPRFCRWKTLIVALNAAVSSGLDAQPESVTVVTPDPLVPAVGSFVLADALSAATSESAIAMARKPVSFRARSALMRNPLLRLTPKPPAWQLRRYEEAKDCCPACH